MDDVEKRRQPVDRVQFPRQRRGQVEAEAVHMHLQHPVTQAVHDQLEDLRVADVERVAATGEIHVMARVILDHPVIDGVVHAAQAQGRPLLITFAGVVVDHIQDDFDAGLVQGLDHILEFAHRLIGSVTDAVAGIRGEKVQ